MKEQEKQSQPRPKEGTAQTEKYTYHNDRGAVQLGDMLGSHNITLRGKMGKPTLTLRGRCAVSKITLHEPTKGATRTLPRGNLDRNYMPIMKRAIQFTHQTTHDPRASAEKKETAAPRYAQNLNRLTRPNRSG